VDGRGGWNCGERVNVNWEGGENWKRKVSRVRKVRRVNETERRKCESTFLSQFSL